MLSSYGTHRQKGGSNFKVYATSLRMSVDAEGKKTES